MEELNLNPIIIHLQKYYFFLKFFMENSKLTFLGIIT